MKYLALFGLKKEAVLLDSWLYIFKAMVAISVGFILGNAFSITRLDMISVLLGVMYNLEPINVNAFKGGINQLLASSLGALTTGLLIVLFDYQISFIVVALGIGFTLYIALKIDYRMVSPVAIFTSIYMSQFLQSNAQGLPSVWLTFRLRIIALGLGVLIALVFNYLFSLLYYQKIGRKRLEYVKRTSILAFEQSYAQLKQKLSPDQMQGVMTGVFNDVDMVRSNLEAIQQERLFIHPKHEREQIGIYLKAILELKLLVHLSYDNLYLQEDQMRAMTDKEDQFFKDMIDALKKSDFLQLNRLNEIEYTADAIEDRLADNVSLMASSYARLCALMKSL